MTSGVEMRPRDEPAGARRRRSTIKHDNHDTQIADHSRHKNIDDVLIAHQ